MTNIFVAKLDFSVTEEELRSLFEAYGGVKKVHIATDRETGKPRGFAFVEMYNDEQAQRAIAELDCKKINGRDIAVKEAEDRRGNNSTLRNEIKENLARLPVKGGKYKGAKNRRTKYQEKFKQKKTKKEIIKTSWHGAVEYYYQDKRFGKIQGVAKDYFFNDVTEFKRGSIVTFNERFDQKTNRWEAIDIQSSSMTNLTNHAYDHIVNNDLNASKFGYEVLIRSGSEKLEEILSLFPNWLKNEDFVSEMMKHSYSWDITRTPDNVVHLMASRFLYEWVKNENETMYLDHFFRLSLDYNKLFEVCKKDPELIFRRSLREHKNIALVENGLYDIIRNQYQKSDKTTYNKYLKYLILECRYEGDNYDQTIDIPPGVLTDPNFIRDFKEVLEGDYWFSASAVVSQNILSHNLDRKNFNFFLNWLLERADGNIVEELLQKFYPIILSDEIKIDLLCKRCGTYGFPYDLISLLCFEKWRIINYKEPQVNKYLKRFIEYSSCEQLLYVLKKDFQFLVKNHQILFDILSKAFPEDRRSGFRELSNDDLVYVVRSWEYRNRKISTFEFNWIINYSTIEFFQSFVENNCSFEPEKTEVFDAISGMRLSSEKKQILLDYIDESLRSNTAGSDNWKYWQYLFSQLSLEKTKKMISDRLGYSSSSLDKIYDSIKSDNNKKNLFVLLFKKEILSDYQPPRRVRDSSDKHLSATDLADFTFCKGSFVLRQRYDLQNFTDEEFIEDGNKEHAKQRLIRLSDRLKVKGRSQNEEFKDFGNDFRRLFNSEVISVGHGEKDVKVYYSEKKTLAGVPDYIFKDEMGYYAVEEKFTFRESNELPDIFDNHLTQALAYLYGISEYALDEVKVVYWFVNKNSLGDLSIKGYRVYSVYKNYGNKENIKSTFNEAFNLEVDDFSMERKDLNYNKCIRCSLFSICQFNRGVV